jgi:hypothetical protein
MAFNVQRNSSLAGSASSVAANQRVGDALALVRSCSGRVRDPVGRASHPRHLGGDRP